jgi:hypothetical protein
MNIEMLKRVRDRILMEELPVLMDAFFLVSADDKEKHWGIRSGKSEYAEEWMFMDSICDNFIPSSDGIGEHGCKTAGCIAGHAIMEAYGSMKREDLPKEVVHAYTSGRFHIDLESLGSKALDLTEAETDVLFYEWAWPETMYKEYKTLMLEGHYLEANKVVAKRIDHFIETGE